MNTNMNVATTILEQLGGNRFCVMTGARQFVGSPNALRFRVPFVCRDGSSIVNVTLTPADDYTVETFSRRGTLKSSVSGVYCDNLVSVFESITGLAARL